MQNRHWHLSTLPMQRPGDIMRDAKIYSFVLLIAASGCDAARAEPDRSAHVTEKHGDVYKRGFIDWTKEEWGDPTPARLGDRLSEGMQLGTGDKSWAQLTWKNVSARAWENSVYAVAPNQRLVYLTGGQMLFQLDKKRKDKAAYYVWTKLLQARMRGTTALVQAEGNVARVTVLEGTIDVLNRVDHSLVRLQPGVVYEVRARDSSPATAGSATVQGGLSAGIAPGGSLNRITTAGQPALPLFDSGKTVTSLLALDPAAVLQHPLLQGFTTPLASIGLISSAMSALPPALSVADATALTTELASSTVSSTLSSVQTAASDSLPSATAAADNTAGALIAAFGEAADKVATGAGSLDTVLQVISKNAEILSVPKKVPYKAGPLAGNVLPWPAGTAEFPPAGRFDVTANGEFIDVATPVGSSPGQSGLPALSNIGAGTAGLIPGSGMPGPFLGGFAGQTGNFAAIGAAAGLTAASSGAGTMVSGAGGALGGAVSGILGGAGSGVTSGAGGAGGLTGGLLPGGTGGSGGGLGGVLPGSGGILPGGGGLLPGGGLPGGVPGLPGH